MDSIAVSRRNTHRVGYPRHFGPISGEITAIEDPSPLVVAALHRFLLAILYRALEGPTDINQAKALFKRGLQCEKIIDYLQKWRNWFWLFDEEHPFYQVPGYEPREQNGRKQWRSWSAMAAEHNADNAKVLFDHVDVTNAGAIPSGKAARWLIACQTFAVGGGKSDFQYTKSGPSATAVMVLPIGQNLQDTLMFSLIPENRAVLPQDKPAWEREPESVVSLQKGFERPISGLADLYSWQTRSIKLHPEAEGKSVSQLVFASGITSSSKGVIDPMLGYRVDEKRGKLPIQIRNRGLWRDFDSLLPDEAHLAPRVIEHATVLTKHDRRRFPSSIMVLGQANNKAKIECWRMERFILPEAIAGERSIRAEIRQNLNDAEEAQRALWTSCASFTRDLLSRGNRKATDKVDKDIRRFIQQMSAIPWFWSTLETHFHEILNEYTLERNTDDIRWRWLIMVRETLRKAWQQHSTSVTTGDVWAIRALVKAEGPLRKKLKELAEEIRKLEPEKEAL